MTSVERGSFLSFTHYIGEEPEAFWDTSCSIFFLFVYKYEIHFLFHDIMPKSGHFWSGLFIYSYLFFPVSGNSVIDQLIAAKQLASHA